MFKSSFSSFFLASILWIPVVTFTPTKGMQDICQKCGGYKPITENLAQQIARRTSSLIYNNPGKTIAGLGVLGSMYWVYKRVIVPQRIRNQLKDIADFSVFHKLYAEEVEEELGPLIRKFDDGENIEEGILLYGPKGTGKTFLGEFICNEYNFQKIFQHCVHLKGDRYINSDTERMKELKEKICNASAEGKVVVILDEIDKIAEPRIDNKNSSALALAEFLDTYRQNPNVLIIGTTNEFDLIDDTIRDRRMISIKIDLPTEKSRERILSHLIANKMWRRAQDIAPGNYYTVPYLFRTIAKKTQGFSANHLRMLLTTAIDEALKDGFTGTDGGCQVTLQQKHFEKGLKKIRTIINRSKKNTTTSLITRENFSTFVTCAGLGISIFGAYLAWQNHQMALKQQPGPGTRAAQAVDVVYKVVDIAYKIFIAKRGYS